jgi:hypothetical protein
MATTRGRVVAVISTDARRRVEEDSTMAPLNWKVMTWSLGLFAVVTFIICVVYGLVMPKALHMTQFLEITLPGFWWLSLGSFILGLVETFLYGAYAGLVFTGIHNFVQRRCA